MRQLSCPFQVVPGGDLFPSDRRTDARRRGQGITLVRCKDTPQAAAEVARVCDVSEGGFRLLAAVRYPLGAVLAVAPVGWEADIVATSTAGGEDHPPPTRRVLPVRRLLQGALVASSAISCMSSTWRPEKPLAAATWKSLGARGSTSRCTG